MNVGRIGSSMADGQEQAILDYESGQGRNYEARGEAWKIGYTAMMERYQLSRGRKKIQDLQPERLNRRA